jgi:hypothetical protein
VNLSAGWRIRKLYFLKFKNLKKMTGEIIKLITWPIFILVSWYVVWFAVKKYEKKNTEQEGK